MAHGYYRIAGKPAVVMCHVTVGTANCINGLMNATRDNIPLLLAAGRTPLTETGHKASRQRSIHWGQEAFDQGGMVREFVKWDYEFRSGQPVEALVDRALDIAMSEPRGPVYLMLPREVLCDPVVPMRRDTVRPLGAVAPAPSAGGDRRGRAADRQCGVSADHHLGGGPHAGRRSMRSPGSPRPTRCRWCRRRRAISTLPTDHPMNFGFDVKPWLPKADVVVVLDSRGAVDSAHGAAEARREDHPYLARSAAHPLSVPRIRSRPADHRRSGGAR